MAVWKLMCFVLLVGSVCSSTGRTNENAEETRGFPFPFQFQAPMSGKVFQRHIKRLENATRYGVDGDPDFIVDVHGTDRYPLCFHVGGQQGEVLRLLQHQNLSLFVNAKIIERNETRKTYLGSVAIIRNNVRIFATRRDVQVNRYTFSWSGMAAFRLYGNRVIVGQNLLAVTFRNKNVTLVIRRHVMSVDYDDSFEEPSNNVGESMSEIVHGHIRPSSHDVTSRNHAVLSQKYGLRLPWVLHSGFYGTHYAMPWTLGTPTYSMATLTERMNHGTGRNVTCWRLRRGGDNIVDGNYIDYMVPQLRDTEIIRFQ